MHAACANSATALFSVLAACLHHSPSTYQTSNPAACVYARDYTFDSARWLRRPELRIRLYFLPGGRGRAKVNKESVGVMLFYFILFFFFILFFHAAVASLDCDACGIQHSEVKYANETYTNAAV